MGKKVVVTGVPGVGKTTVITGAMEILASEGITYESINFGTFMFELAEKEKLVSNRDEMRKLDRDVQKRLQSGAASGIAARSGNANVIIDTHSSVKTPKGYLAGLPEWVLRELMPDVIVLVETDEDQILLRRLGDESRVRDLEGSRSITEHQQFNRSVSAAYAMYTGCTIKIIRNENYLLDKAVAEMVEVLR
ncbi:adenylate kinase [Methanoculleus taiwanensis]|uniref:Adenylate kinase n=1 Tax=Methanoculleus taiwanensis TaxID=1550565 RepID=A0A498GZ03_9EURY|nr:adenylate kinase [Methanoculleus taiwanensis]RXE55772.1 adenylate kinase [Methanoculleus taiwanensis]